MNVTAFPKEFPVTAEQWGASAMSTPRGPPLTDHGKNVIRKMGEWFAGNSEYASLVENSCDSIFVYADDCLRDDQTADFFLEGFSPSCSATVHPSHADAAFLFNQGNLPRDGCKIANRDVVASLLGADGNDFSAFIGSHMDTINEIQEVVKCCKPVECSGASESVK